MSLLHLHPSLQRRSRGAAARHLQDDEVSGGVALRAGELEGADQPRRFVVGIALGSSGWARSCPERDREHQGE
jgi:hypothetical protein